MSKFTNLENFDALEQLLEGLIKGGPWAVMLGFLIYYWAIPTVKRQNAKNDQLLDLAIDNTKQLQERMNKVEAENIAMSARQIELEKSELKLEAANKMMLAEIEQLKQSESRLESELRRRDQVIEKLRKRIAELEKKD